MPTEDDIAVAVQEARQVYFTDKVLNVERFEVEDLRTSFDEFVKMFGIEPTHLFVNGAGWMEMVGRVRDVTLISEITTDVDKISRGQLGTILEKALLTDAFFAENLRFSRMSRWAYTK